MLMVSHPFFADFDGDNFVGSSDIEHAVKLLTQNELAMDEIESIWEKVRSGEIAEISIQSMSSEEGKVCKKKCEG